MPPGLWLRAATLLPLPRRAAVRQCSYKNNRRPAAYIELRERNSSHTVGLVVEYSPATGETRVRFPDGVLGIQERVNMLFAMCTRENLTRNVCPLVRTVWDS